MNHDNPFLVEWSKTALRTLFGFNKIDHDSVYRLSQNLLSKEPFAQADKVADYENYRYNGYCIKMIHNVVIVYTVNVNTKKVLICACHHGRTGEVAKILYSINPPLAINDRLFNLFNSINSTSNYVLQQTHYTVKLLVVIHYNERQLPPLAVAFSSTLDFTVSNDFNRDLIS